MRTIFAVLLLGSSAFAAEPVVHRDLPYAEPNNERQTLDVYAPSEGKDHPEGNGHPIIFWINGSAGEKGDRERNDKAGTLVRPQALANQGFVFVSVKHRLPPAATVQQMAEDVAKAIRWTCDHAKDYGGDPQAILVGGHSAGAQLAVLVCTDDSYLKAEGLPLSIVKGCVPMDGDTYDAAIQVALEPAKGAHRPVRSFGTDQDRKELSRATHIAEVEDVPPFLILHAAKNPLSEAQAKRLYRVLHEVDIRAKVVADDGKTLGAFTSDLNFPLEQPAYALFGYLEGIIRPRSLETFRATLDKTFTPEMAEAAFGTPNALAGSGIKIFVYKLSDGTYVLLGFGGPYRHAAGERGYPFGGIIRYAKHGTDRTSEGEEDLPLK